MVAALAAAHRLVGLVVLLRRAGLAQVLLVLRHFAGTLCTRTDHRHSSDCIHLPALLIPLTFYSLLSLLPGQGAAVGRCGAVLHCLPLRGSDGSEQSVDGYTLCGASAEATGGEDTADVGMLDNR